MIDAVDFQSRVEKRMIGFLASGKKVRRDAFASELEHNLRYEASQSDPSPSDALIEETRAAISDRYSARLINY